MYCGQYTESVQFNNVQDYVIKNKKPSRIMVEYSVDKNVEVSCKDWIGLFPKISDFSTIDLNLLVAFEFVLQHSGSERSFKMHISLCGANNLKCGEDYMFVYCSKYSEVLGFSKVFRILELVSSEPPSLQPLRIIEAERDKTDETDGKAFKNRRWNRDTKRGLFEHKGVSTYKTGHDGVQETDLVNLQDQGHGSRTKKMNQIFSKQSGAVCGPGGVPTCRGPAMSCSNCHRVGSLLNTQSQLQAQIKNMAEKNRDLEEQVNWLKEQVQLGQAAFQKLSVKHMQEREAKLAYQRAAQTEQLQVYIVEDAKGKHRSEEKARTVSSLKLKAIIGCQEETIRSLSEKIAELESGKVLKVKAFVKDLNGKASGDQQFNNNSGEGAVVTY